MGLLQADLVLGIDDISEQEIQGLHSDKIYIYGAATQSKASLWS